MKCPIIILGRVNQGECLEKECAWWDELETQCCFKTLADKIADMRDDLIQIRDKMPHEEQFRK